MQVGRRPFELRDQLGQRDGLPGLLRVGAPPLDKPFPGDVLDRDAILREVPRNRKRPRCLAMGEKVIFMSPCLFYMDSH